MWFASHESNFHLHNQVLFEKLKNPNVDLIHEAKKKNKVTYLLLFEGKKRKFVRINLLLEMYLFFFSGG